jgi:hypothetical protein
MSLVTTINPIADTSLQAMETQLALSYKELNAQLAEARKMCALHSSRIKEYDEEFDQRVIALANKKNKAFKAGWKENVNEGLVRHVRYILGECHHFLTDETSERGADLARVACERMGEFTSAKCEAFLFQVIQYLWSEGSFGDLEHGFDSFEDTAGGCDEITEDAAIYLLKHPDWKLKKA